MPTGSSSLTEYPWSPEVAKYLVNLSTEDGDAGNAGTFVADNPDQAVSLAKEKFGPDFPVVLDVTPV